MDKVVKQLLPYLTKPEYLAAAVLGVAIMITVIRMVTGGKKPAQTAAVSQPAAKPSASTGFLHPQDWKKVKLVHKEKVNHNTNLYRFALPNSSDVLNLPVGKHVKLGFMGPEGKMVQRAYTPVSIADQKGHFDLIIKIYPTGAMSQHVEKLKIGDEIDVRGPNGLMKYEPNMYDEIGMIAGGSGITPMVQLARYIVGNAADKARASLIFANIAEQDILLRDELDRMAASSAGRFKRFYVLEKAPEGWEMGKGFVSQDHIRANLPAPGPRTKILLCGPPPMLDAMQKHLAALGYEKDMIFQY